MRQYKYNISQDEFDALWALQSGRCAICRSGAWPGKGPHLDHDHATGEVRGVLCHKCNLGLGKFDDRIDLLEAAIAYLQR